MTLEPRFPDIYEHFKEGFFLISKVRQPVLPDGTGPSTRAKTIVSFSIVWSSLSLSCQQSQWETHGPNVARLIGEFKDSSKPTNTDDEPENHLHHEDSQAYRNKFSRD